MDQAELLAKSSNKLSRRTTNVGNIGEILEPRTNSCPGYMHLSPTIIIGAEANTAFRHSVVIAVIAIKSIMRIVFRSVG